MMTQTINTLPTAGPFLPINKVMLITGKSRSTIYRWKREGRFPEPVQIGPNSIAWSTKAVNDWVNSKLQPISSKLGAH